MANIIEVTDITIEELNIYTGLSEVALLRYFEPQPGIFIAESPKVIERGLMAGYEPISVLMQAESNKEDEKLVLEKVGDAPVYKAKEEILSKIKGFALTRGMMCAMRRKPLPVMADILKGARRIAVLENVVNPTNIGAIVRSAAALNMDGIIFSKNCCDPLYRRAIRVSMGTIFQIPWTFAEQWPKEGMEFLREQGFKTVAMALKEDSLQIEDKQLASQDKLAVLLGAEGDGLSNETLDMCDYTVCIPMSHGVDSLNVAAASAIAFWQLGNK